MTPRKGELDDIDRFLHRRNAAYKQISESLSSYQRALIFVATDLIRREIGSRVPSKLEYARQIGVGVGTVHKALNYLETQKGAELRARGHLGTYLTKKTIGILWRHIRDNPVRIVVGPAHAAEFSGLERGILRAFEKLGIATTIHHSHGSSARAKAIKSGEFDLGFVSKFAYQQEFNHRTTQAISLGEFTYYQPRSLLRLTRNTDRKMTPLRVGLDPSSLDHEGLTRLIFDGGQEDVEVVDCSYEHIPTALLAGHIDTAVWHEATLGVPLEALPLSVQPLDNCISANELRDISAAQLVSVGNSPVTSAILPQIDVDLVRRVQLQTISDFARRADELKNYFKS